MRAAAVLPNAIPMQASTGAPAMRFAVNAATAIPAHTRFPARSSAPRAIPLAGQTRDAKPETASS